MDKMTKAKAEKIGRDLFYDAKFFRDLDKATTDAEIQRCLIDARHRWKSVA